MAKVRFAKKRQVKTAGSFESAVCFFVQGFFTDFMTSSPTQDKGRLEWGTPQKVDSKGSAVFVFCGEAAVAWTASPSGDRRLLGSTLL
jgi:hypothetical protein